MDPFLWNCPAPVGVARLDAQHLRMHSLIRGLVKTLEGGATVSLAEEQFMELSETIMEHFMTEENFLETQGYPGLIAHRYEHEILFERVWERLIRRHSLDAPPLIEIIQGVADLIQLHQETVDSVYAAWLASR